MAINNSCSPEIAGRLIIMGKIGSAYGVRGWLRMISSAEKVTDIFSYQPWFIKQSAKWQQVELEGWKYHNQHLIIKINTVDDRESASLLSNLDIFVDAAKLPSLETGEYYWKDLIGCRVVTTSGYELGHVVDMMATGSNDVMLIKAMPEDKFGIQERLLPFIDDQVIKAVDLAAKLIEADWDPDF